MRVCRAVSAFGPVVVIGSLIGSVASSRCSGAEPAWSEIPGAWEPAVSTAPVRAWSMALLPTGKVLLFQNATRQSVWDPRTRTFTTVRSSTNIFCSGIALLGDGRLLAAGGHAPKVGDCQVGLASAELFDPWARRWRRLEDMRGGERWYPSVLLLPTGDAAVLSGTHLCENNQVVEAFRPDVGGWTILGRQPRGRSYPPLFVLPDGRILGITGGRTTRIYDGRLQASRRVGDLGVDRSGAAAVLLPGPTGEVLCLGGGKEESPEASAEIFDRRSGTWSATGSMAHRRHHPDAVILPDGRILAIGGHDETHTTDPRVTEIYDVAARRWWPCAAMSEMRGYHSTALLLPDGRVVAAGPEPTLEVYRPWYFFRQRPRIDSSPGEIFHGFPFQLEVRSSGVSRVTLVRASSVTHSLNTDQRLVELEITARDAGRVEVAGPRGPTVAPPGYYLLFVLDDGGVPSPGRMVRLRRARPGFQRGEANGDGRTDLSDAVWILLKLFVIDRVSFPCADAADVNDDGALDVTDPIHLLRFLFLEGPPPPPPASGCGTDPTSDGLACGNLRVCD